MPKPLKKKPKTIGIIGSRRRDTQGDFDACLTAFERVYHPGDRLVSGGCPRGGDRFAEVIARTWGLTLTIHYPDWSKNGKVAGFLRNTLIAQDADVLIAVVAEDRKGGTEDTVRKAKNLGRKVILA